MEKPTQIFLFGSLAERGGGALSSPIHCPLEGPIPLPELLERLPVEPGRINLVMVNHRAVSPAQVIRPGDRVALFPKEYAIFADWADLRL